MRAANILNFTDVMLNHDVAAVMDLTKAESIDV